MIVALFGAVAIVAAQDTLAISLEDATRRAVAVSPAVFAAGGAVAAPRGARAEAWWPFPENPNLEYGSIRRRAPTLTTYDPEWSVTQEVEVAGQWVFRGEAAAARVRSAEAHIDDERRIAALEVRRAYVGLAVAERAATLTDSAADFAERLAQFARRQFEAGETNRLEVNAAVLEAARARSAAERARARLSAAAAELGRVLALPSDSTARTMALPAVPALRWSSDSVLLGIARQRRPDLRASQELQRSTERASVASRLSLVPNLAVGVTGGREAATDHLFGFVIGLRFPLFHRQQAATGAADAERAAARADAVAAERRVRADVLAASARFMRARASEERFATGVLRAATENVTLTERALAEGEVSLTDVLVLRRSAVDAQLEYLEVLGDAYAAWFELAAALGVEPVDLATLVTGEH